MSVPLIAHTCAKGILLVLSLSRYTLHEPTTKKNTHGHSSHNFNIQIRQKHSESAIIYFHVIQLIPECFRSSVHKKIIWTTYSGWDRSCQGGYPLPSSSSVAATDIVQIHVKVALNES